MASPFIKRYLLALDRYKWAGLTTFLGIFGISGVIAMKPLPQPEYESQGVLVQNFPLVAFTTTGNEVQQRGQGIISEEFLLADVLLQQVSQELESKDNISLQPKDIRNNTDVEVEAGDKQLQRVTVTFTWPDREVAQTTLNLMFEGMVELSRVTNRARLRAIIEALNERLPDIETELRNAEQQLETYDRVEGPAIQAALDGSLLSAISGSQNQYRQNLISLAGIEAQMRSIQQQLGLTPDQAFTSSALSADPIIAQLRAEIYRVETQLELLSKDLRPAHPTIQELQKNLDAYNKLLEERAQEVIGGGSLVDLPSAGEVRRDSALDPARAGLANQLTVLKTQRDALIQQQRVLLQSANQLREQYSQLPNKQLERDRLAQQVALKRALYDQVQARRIDTQAAEAEIVSSLTVAEPPSTRIQEQEAQNPLAILIVGGLVGLAAGGAVIFLLDAMDGTLRTYEDIQGLLRDQDVPLLGLIPKMPTTSPRLMPLVSEVSSPYADGYERLRSNLRLAGSQSESGVIPTTILVTSTRDKEGKTSTAFNLAMASARAGRRTLIVEADLGIPSQAYQLGVSPLSRAQTEPLRYYGGQLGEPIQLVPHVQNLYIAPSPGPQRQGAAIIESSEMERFLAEARGRFDMVILDAPPLSRNNDAILLEGETDGLIIVARPGLTEKAILNAAIEQLLDTEDLDVLGAVINDADIPVELSTRLQPMISPEDLPAPITPPSPEPPVPSRVEF